MIFFSFIVNFFGICDLYPRATYSPKNTVIPHLTVLLSQNCDPLHDCCTTFDPFMPYVTNLQSTLQSRTPLNLASPWIEKNLKKNFKTIRNKFNHGEEELPVEFNTKLQMYHKVINVMIQWNQMIINVVLGEQPFALSSLVQRNKKYRISTQKTNIN